MARVDWSRFSADPRRPEVAGVRATDADRDSAVAALREAFADGRLDRDEFDHRCAEALRVHLLGELVPLLADLEPPVPVERDVRREAIEKYRRESREARTGTVAIAVLTTGVWGATSLSAGEPQFFWPVFPILGVGAGWLVLLLNRGDRIARHERRILARRREKGQT